MWFPLSLVLWVEMTLCPTLKFGFSFFLSLLRSLELSVFRLLPEIIVSLRNSPEYEIFGSKIPKKRDDEANESLTMVRLISMIVFVFVLV